MKCVDEVGDFMRCKIQHACAGKYVVDIESEMTVMEGRSQHHYHVTM